MEWQVKSISRQCAVSNEPLRTGDRVTCVIFKPENLPIERVDMLEKNAADFKITGIELGRWTREIKDRAHEERETRMQLLATREEFFFSLFADDADPTGDKAVLKQLLALLLERKRILRVRGPVKNNVQSYRHVRTQTEFLVPMHELMPEQLIQIQPALETLVG